MRKLTEHAYPHNMYMQHQVTKYGIITAAVLKRNGRQLLEKWLVFCRQLLQATALHWQTASVSSSPAYRDLPGCAAIEPSTVVIL